MKHEEQRIRHRDLHGLTEEESQEYTRLFIESIRERNTEEERQRYKEEALSQGINRRQYV